MHDAAVLSCDDDLKFEWSYQLLTAEVTVWTRRSCRATLLWPGNKKQGSWLIDMPLLRLQIMKYQQLSKKACGDGAVTCRVCNY